VQRRLYLKANEQRAVAEGEAGLKAAEARLRQANVAIEEARLVLERTVVRAPASGRALVLAARPGARLMGLATGAHQDSGNVVTMYDPALLQVRTDVRLEDVPRVRPGQLVPIETPTVGRLPLDGEAVFAKSQADIQKNTLQVKVGIKAPPPIIKPDMLVLVTFLAPHAVASRSEPQAQPRLLVPMQLIHGSADGAFVWLTDQAAAVARRRTVEIGSGMAGVLVEVVKGLRASDKMHIGLQAGIVPAWQAVRADIVPSLRQV
jgi:multidrug efflux pump subunit AcrA (membrane-fusion protein)